MPLARETGDERRVRLRVCAAQHVIQVRDVQDHPQFAAQFAQNVEQRKRIRAAGDADDDGVADLDEMMLCNCGTNGVKERHLKTKLKV